MVGELDIRSCGSPSRANFLFARYPTTPARWRLFVVDERPDYRKRVTARTARLDRELRRADASFIIVVKVRCSKESAVEPEPRHRGRKYHVPYCTPHDAV
jgi:hypothetical protein